ncbi:hypothetical protein [Nocardioides zeicaulis]|uniref:DUF4383 domain-containing protein n=1 Tax=Nocardioides zeicaulis TaxID=1776857 RepID=A0ABV6E3E1_9ACTN
MPHSKIAAPAAVVGGLLLVLAALLGGGDGPLVSTLHLLGLAGLVVSAGLFGSTLVRSDAAGMRVLVGLASGLLVLSLVEAFRPATTHWYDAFWGVLALALGVLGLVRGRGTSGTRAGSGAHAH